MLVYWRDCQAGETRLITPDADGACRNPILSADGRYVAYASVARNIVTNAALLPASGRAAVYLYDSQTGTTTIISLSSTGQGLSTGVGSTVPHYEFDFSANGQYVFFSTDATNVHPARSTVASQAYHWLYRRNLSDGTVDVVCRNATNAIPTSGNFTTPRCDATGNRVLFTGGFVAVFGGPTMIPGYTYAFGFDLYLKDLSSGEVWWITRTTNNTTPDASLGGVAINANGTVVAFGSTGTKFVSENTDPPPSNDSFDLFRVDIGPAGSITNTLVTKAVVGTNNVGYFSGPFLPGTGDYVAFVTRYLYSLLGQRTDSSFFIHGVAVGTFPAQSTSPVLHFKTLPGHVTFLWPASSGLNLYIKEALAADVWAPVTNPPVNVGGTNHLTLPASGAASFFRLQNP
jgi:Tol biopolymer transport system component